MNKETKPNLQERITLVNHRFSDNNILVFIILFLLLIYSPFILSRRASGEDFLKGDGFYYRAIIVSLLNDHDLVIANNLSGTDLLNGQLALGKDGLVPKHPILMPLVSIPFYRLFSDAGLLLFNIADCILLILFIFKLNRLFFNPIISGITTILYSTGTLFLDYVYNYSPDIFSSVILIAGLYSTLKKRYYIGAVLFGLSIFAKVTNAPLVGVIFIYVFLINKTQPSGSVFIKKENFLNNLSKTIGIGSILILSLIPMFYVNYSLFGSPFITGYQQTVIADQATGEMTINNHLEDFNQPFLAGGYKLLFDPLHGVLLTNPVIILAFMGVIITMTNRYKNKELLLIFFICLAQFIIFSKYDYWQTSHFSNRFMMTFIALSSTFTSSFLSYFFQDRRKPIKDNKEAQ